jgi:hypothetical protein
LPKGITSLTGYIRKLEALDASKSGDLFFRGHSRASHTLLPSIFRDIGFQNSERELLLTLLAESPKEFETDKYTFDRLVRAQHYGVPTRLLDVTINPLMALYFACESCSEDRGTVVVFTVPKNEQKFFSSDAVSCKANLSQLTEFEREQIILEEGEAVKEVFKKAKVPGGLLYRKNKDPEKYAELILALNKKPTMRRLVQFIKEEKPYFENVIDPSDLRRIVAVIPKKNNARISAQSGAFLIFGLNKEFNGATATNIVQNRIDIFPESKRSILRALVSIGIDSNTVYPEMEKIASELKNRFKSNP